MNSKKKDLLSGIVFLAFAVFVYAGSFSIKQTTSDVLGSRFFPQVVAVLIGILSVAQIIGAVLGMKDGNAEETKAESVGKKWNLPLILTTAALFAYYILINWIGFVPTSILYLLFECSVLMTDEERKNKKELIILLLIAVLVPIVLNYIFWNIFSIRLPLGSLFK